MELNFKKKKEKQSTMKFSCILILLLGHQVACNHCVGSNMHALFSQQFDYTHI